MDKIKVSGPSKISGTVFNSGSKNATLPILFATLLCPGTHNFSNIPHLADIHSTLKLLSHLGCETHLEDHTCKVVVPEDIVLEAPYDLVRKMRASILCLGPILARKGEAKVSLPGGCAIGARPIDLHLKAMEKLSAKVEIKAGYVKAIADKLYGAEVVFDTVTVGGTENLLMAASLAEGTTVIKNAACEPEVEDLGNFLISLGAKITGLGTKTISITGVEKLKAPEKAYPVISDRIEAGTYICAALATKGKITVENSHPNHLDAFLEKISEMGAIVKTEEDKIYVEWKKDLVPFTIKTTPYPGFPTDLQAQMMALATTVNGTSKIEENIFENRYMHVPELQRLGASIELSSKVAVINGGAPLNGAQTMATDLRASASLIIAGLAAEGETLVNRIYHLDRGYEKIEEKFSALGVNIERVPE